MEEMSQTPDEETQEYILIKLCLELKNQKNH